MTNHGCPDLTDKRGTIAPDARPILRRLGIDDTQWQDQVFGIETPYWRAVGAVDALLAKARAMGQCWLKGGRGSEGRRHLTNPLTPRGT